VQKYLNTPGPNRKPDPKQRWLTFVRNHANAIVASDFFVVVTAKFRILMYSCASSWAPGEFSITT
jgi:putative transposase